MWASKRVEEKVIAIKIRGEKHLGKHVNCNDTKGKRNLNTVNSISFCWARVKDSLSSVRAHPFESNLPGGPCLDNVEAHA